MLDLYLVILCILVACTVYIYVKREHLTVKDVDKKVTKLEDEYKKLHNVVETQEKRMAGASSQASAAKANFDSIKL